MIIVAAVLCRKFSVPHGESPRCQASLPKTTSADSWLTCLLAVAIDLRVTIDPMNVRIIIAAVGALIITGTLTECLDQDEHNIAGCLRACGWDEQKSLTKRARASSSLSCDKCLRRRRDLYRHAITAFVRRRRQSLSYDCASRADDNSPVPEIQLASNVAVKFGQYDNTDYWYAYVSWSPINDPAGFLKGYSVRYLYDIDILCANVPKNQTSVRINISGYGYNQGEKIHLLVVSIPYNRTGVGMLIFPKDKTSTSPPPSQTMTSVRVTTKSSTAAKASIATETSKARTTTKGSDKPMKYVSISVGAVAGVLAVVLAGVFHKKFIRICVKHEGFNYDRPPGDIEPENHDIFIIFNSNDKEFVDKELLPLIEEQHGLKCRVHYRDFRAGGIIYNLMSDHVNKSYKNVVVYSKNFLKSGFCDFELNQAKHRLLRKNDDSLVIIRKDDVDLSSLPEDLRDRSVIDYGSIHEKPHWERKLIEFLKLPNKNRHESTKSNDTVVSSIDDVDPIREEVF